MGEWKGSWSRDGIDRNEGRDNQSNSWKSPHSRASNPTFDLALEKEFCQYLSSITWGRLFYAQKYTYLYKNILQWDDSGALESFQAARSRFNAEYSGEPCDNPLPDRDMYIDIIDHDCIIDPELISDIEKELVPPETTKARHQTSTGTNGWDSVECTDRLVPATGWESWGDSGDRDKEKDNLNNWDIYVENKPIEYTGWENNDRFDDPWESENKATGWGNNNISYSSAWDQKEDYNNDGNKATGWGNNNISSAAWDRKEPSNNDGWNNSWNNNSWYRRTNEANNRNGRKRDGSVGNGGFRVRKIRYTGDRCQVGSNWKGSRGRNNRNYPYNAAFS
ncbi:uncharacterized protein LOC144547574 isoform X1 [Carex rostrata]